MCEVVVPVSSVVTAQKSRLGGHADGAGDVLQRQWSTTAEEVALGGTMLEVEVRVEFGSTVNGLHCCRAQGQHVPRRRAEGGRSSNSSRVRER